MIETATGRRTPSGVMHQGDVGFRAGRDIDRVIADAEARDDAEPPAFRNALRREAVGQQDQRVEILKLVAAQADWPTSRNSISTPGADLSGARSKSGKVGEPSAFLKSPDSATRNGPVMACSPARKVFIASVSASRSTQTSPE